MSRETNTYKLGSWALAIIAAGGILWATGDHIRFLFQVLVPTYRSAFQSVQHKVQVLEHADRDNSRLRLENAQLKLKLESAHFACEEKFSEKSTRRIGYKLKQETGTKVGRTLASFTYKPPEGLYPAQLHLLGLGYMRAGDTEKAAVLFTTLASLEDVSTYKTAIHFLTTGMLWFKLDNYELASEYFDEVLRVPASRDSLKYQAQARLWKAVIARKQSKHFKTQFWLKELIDHHPRSPEASWVNRPEARHVSASKHD